MLRLPLSFLSPAGPRSRLSILVFHRVLGRPDSLGLDVPVATEFEARMRWVKTWFNVLPLGVAVDRLFSGTLPQRALAITFDDGYADNEELAAPILRRLGMTATFFVATGFLEGGCMWNDRIIEAIRACESEVIDLTSLGLTAHVLRTADARRKTISKVLSEIKHFEPQRRQAVTDAIVELAGAKASPQLMMRPEQVRSLRALGMDIGAHTVTHPILSRLSSDAAFAEMRESKKELERIVGEPILSFAYPNGVPGQDYVSEHAAMAHECGFSAAVSTAWGAASMSSDRFQLPRFTPWDRTRLRYGVRLLGNLGRREQIAS
jgi:peptidoglycan/xylan/chitin deacetylase (PgdA/CDA1 family)